MYLLRASTAGNGRSAICLLGRVRVCIPLASSYTYIWDSMFHHVRDFSISRPSTNVGMSSKQQQKNQQMAFTVCRSWASYFIPVHVVPTMHVRCVPGMYILEVQQCFISGTAVCIYVRSTYLVRLCSLSRFSFVTQQWHVSAINNCSLSFMCTIIFLTLSRLDVSTNGYTAVDKVHPYGIRRTIIFRLKASTFVLARQMTILVSYL